MINSFLVKQNRAILEIPGTCK